MNFIVPDLIRQITIAELRTKPKFVLAVLLAGAMSAGCPGWCDEKPNQTSQRTNPDGGAEKAPSPEDILIVQLTDKADRSEFDDLLKEVHGKVINTLDFGPKLQLLIVQTEPGKADEVAKRLSKDKDVARVQRNQTYHINEGTPAPGN